MYVSYCKIYCESIHAYESTSKMLSTHENKGFHFKRWQNFGLGAP